MSAAARRRGPTAAPTVRVGSANLPDWLRYDRRGRYTLHLTFAAVDFDTAREQAVAYAEGLTILCPELGEHAPLLSRAEAWNFNEPLFCGVRGPDGEVCAEVRHHPGFHRAAGLGGLCWGDGDGDADTDGRWIHADLAYVCRDRWGGITATTAAPEPPGWRVD